jgi:hypothetical protein
MLKRRGRRHRHAQRNLNLERATVGTDLPAPAVLAACGASPSRPHCLLPRTPVAARAITTQPARRSRLTSVEHLPLLLLGLECLHTLLQHTRGGLWSAGRLVSPRANRRERARAAGQAALTLKSSSNVENSSCRSLMAVRIASVGDAGASLVCTFTIMSCTSGCGSL